MNFCYVLRCADGTLYTGWTNDLERRLKTHNAGKGGKYTRARLPVELVYYEQYPTKAEAMGREWRIKRMPRAEKLRLIVGGSAMLLRDMTEADIEDYVRWFTTDTEWLNWDAPWEDSSCTEEEARRDWTEYYQRVRELPRDRMRWKFEIEAGGKHIGWISAYTDLGELENPEQLLALGLDIPDTAQRGRGYGSAAMRRMMAYYRGLGQNSFLTQTWSGNERMIALAKKLGFREVSRLRGLRLVNGKSYDALTFRLDFPADTAERD